jgi:hypothetical protein
MTTTARSKINSGRTGVSLKTRLRRRKKKKKKTTIGLTMNFFNDNGFCGCRHFQSLIE